MNNDIQKRIFLVKKVLTLKYTFNKLINTRYLSPYIIIECVNANYGALFYNINTSIIFYADDILLISPLDSHLQLLLDICSNYSLKWRIKFNPLKSNIISFGDYYYPERNFKLSNQLVTLT